MNGYSMDLRERIVAARQANVVDVAARFWVCTKTVYAYVAKAAQGELSPRPRPGRTARLGPSQHEELLQMVRERPDLTLEAMVLEWHKRTSEEVPRSTLYDALRRAGARFKKTRVPLERDEEKRAAFLVQLRQIEPHRPIFVDERSFKAHRHRLYGWAVGGARCVPVSSHRRGPNHSVVGAFSWLCATWHKRGAWNRCTFGLFIEEAVLPHAAPRSVLVWDKPKSTSIPNCVRPSKTKAAPSYSCHLTRPTPTPSSWCGVTSKTASAAKARLDLTHTLD